MAASLLVAASFFVGRVRRLSKGWSFAATQSSGDSAYSPECVKGLFCELRAEGFSEVHYLVTPTTDGFGVAGALAGFLCSRTDATAAAPTPNAPPAASNTSKASRRR
jgi:hypothetical protein